MRVLFIALILSSCAYLDGIRCFSLDGKAASSCKRGLRFERMCKEHDGLREYGGLTGTCNDGTPVK